MLKVERFLISVLEDLSSDVSTSRVRRSGIDDVVLGSVVVSVEEATSSVINLENLVSKGTPMPVTEVEQEQEVVVVVLFVGDITISSVDLLV